MIPSLRDDQAELLANDRENKIGMCVRQNPLHDALARSGSEQAAIAKGAERRFDLVAVTTRGIEKPVDARGDVREKSIGAGQSANPENGDRRDPIEGQPGHEHLSEPNRHDHHRHAEIGLQHEKCQQQPE